VKRFVKSKLFRYFAIAVALLVATVIALPVFGRVSPKSPTIIQLSNLKQVGIALKTYAEEHEGKFPKLISELPTDILAAELRQFHDPSNNKAVDWLYYPGRTTDDLPSTILAASPVAVYKQKRIVMSVDTVTLITSESDFQKRQASPSQPK
jgi:hypothetical protein